LYDGAESTSFPIPEPLPYEEGNQLGIQGSGSLCCDRM
jgi:hypothetical protein